MREVIHVDQCVNRMNEAMKTNFSLAVIFFDIFPPTSDRGIHPPNQHYCVSKNRMSSGFWKENLTCFAGAFHDAGL